MLVYDRKSTPSLRDPAVHLIHSSLGWRVHASNDIWIGSAILAQCTLMTNRPTYRQTVSSEDKKTSEKLKVYFSSCISLCTNCCTQCNTAQKCHQCFGTVGVRKSIQSTKIEWWGVGIVICLEWGADCLADATAIPKPHHLFPYKNFRIGFFWQWLTQVVLEKRPLKVSLSSRQWLLLRYIKDTCNMSVQKSTAKRNEYKKPKVA